MSGTESLLEELEDAVHSAGLSQRAEVLRRVTDLFMLGTGRFSDAQIDLFDQVMSRLVEGVEVAARAKFGSRISKAADAPMNVIRLLAFDDAIDVASPVLSGSERLTEDSLVENAKIKGQGHLLAISRRKWLTEKVTDVLLDRGNQDVVASTASNLGSRFSENGFSRLVDKSSADARLALCVWSRPDIPRVELMRLFQGVSEEVRASLVALRPRHGQQIREAVASAADQLQTLARAGAPEHGEAKAYVEKLHKAGELDEAHILSFARSKNFDRTAVGISLLCDLPIGVVERSLVEKRFEQVLVFAKAAGFSWETTKALLMIKAGDQKISQVDLEQSFATFTRLQSKTAKMALQFYKLREESR